ncbi:phenylacetic acid degradation PaaB family protein [Halomicroarcula sp. F13]|uniref:Phenylacetic acid degradation PaaB family protein n=1 Tax=Haloarcula rubra TaxID=2487747 RepID=A0AAW4PVX1_9EURY|nr:phenylacetic acid degradation PaaB family protein [Halomicroarcula rubra]MBX0325322.1 phenylacetic acid degradation PaaB family protein [Halomicroarcula rubra]QIO24967.1 phenylacetic acid degradation PaaB family protein [Haloarcula sp. JP-L23]
MKYEVFARIRPGEELIHVGNVDAPDDKIVKTYARTTFDEEDWDRMIAVPRAEIVEVAGKQKAESPPRSTQ